MVSNQVDFTGSLFLDNHVLVQGAVSNTAIPKTVATECKTTTNNQSGSDSESRDEFENDDESLQDAYEKMYTQWLQVYTNNCAWVRKNQER